MKNLRDALEHLDEAIWLDDVTLGSPGEKGNAGRALRELPGGSLIFGLGFDEKIMDLVDVGALSRETAAVIATLDREEEEVWQAEAEDLWALGYFDEEDHP
ncbi:hypothetical protein GCM10009854_29310 [Saccharopolyspora halophila]|uniref:Uncharacterized protein n=1 Tax=Saccharopolyspora halophila TaxID=405551 RepID=A0ABN3GEB3_9PSEU